MRGPHRWQSPFLVPVGKLGEARGPTLEIAAWQKKLRDDFKAGAVKLRSDAKAKPALSGPTNDDGAPYKGNGFGPPAPPHRRRRLVLKTP